MSDEQKQEQACLYVLGLLSPGEAAAFERDAGGDAGLRTLVGELRTAAGALPAACSPIEPPRSLKAKIFEEIDRYGESTAAPTLALVPKPRSTVFGRMGWGAAAAVLTAALAFVAHYRDESHKLADAVSTMQADRSAALAAAESANNDLRLAVTKLKEMEAKFAELTKGGLKNQQLIRLGPPNSATPVAMVMWDQEKQKGTMLVDNLPKPAADKDYQLWVLDAAGKPIDCGVFPLAANGMTSVEFGSKKNVDKASKFAITLEPKGGLPAPTLPSGLVMIGG